MDPYRAGMRGVSWRSIPRARVSSDSTLPPPPPPRGSTSDFGLFFFGGMFPTSPATLCWRRRRRAWLGDEADDFFASRRRIDDIPKRAHELGSLDVLFAHHPSQVRRRHLARRGMFDAVRSAPPVAGGRGGPFEARREGDARIDVSLARTRGDTRRHRFRRSDENLRPASSRAARVRTVVTSDVGIPEVWQLDL